MSFLTQECCDVCGKQLTSLDSDGDLVWEGVRMFLDGMKTEKKVIPYYHASRVLPDSPSHVFECQENRLHRSGSSSGPMPSLVIPGAACSVACIEKSLLEWIVEAKKRRPEPAAKTGRTMEL